MPPRPPEFRVARTCYDHLAGVVGVLLHDRLLEDGAIRTGARDRGDVEIMPALEASLRALGIEGWRPSRGRRAAYACRDLTERRPHIGGALGARLCEAILAAGWLTRLEGSRVLAITPRGREELTRRLGPLTA